MIIMILHVFMTVGNPLNYCTTTIHVPLQVYFVNLLSYTVVTGSGFRSLGLLREFVNMYTRKMVPITGRVRSLLVFLEFSKTKRRGKEKEQQTYQFTLCYNILHRLQVHHLTLTFIIHNKYISTLYLYTYIYKLF